MLWKFGERKYEYRHLLSFVFWKVATFLGELEVLIHREGQIVYEAL
jgi:hypothetical protein